MPRLAKVPAYCCHKPSGQARVRFNGKDYYLGRFGSPESRQAYAKLVAENVRPGADIRPSNECGGYPDLSVNEMFVRYLEHARAYYVSNGKPTSEIYNMKAAMRSVRALYESEPAATFGPLALKAVRQHMIDTQKLCRGVVNGRVNRIRRIFKWAVSEELVPSSVFEGLRAVEGLRRGRSGVRETEPVGPVADIWVEATLPFLPPPVADMVRLQRWSSMRPGEVALMRPCDLDRRGDVWIYEPTTHKTQYRGQSRRIALGPKAQKLLVPYLQRAPQAYLFSPVEADAWRRQQRRDHRQRKTPIFPCETERLERERQARLRRQRRRPLGDRYTSASYNRAIHYGIVRAHKAGKDIPFWHPNQLRHSRATEVRRDFGLEAAQVVLGHARADVTQVYAEKNMDLAVKIAKMTG